MALNTLEQTLFDAMERNGTETTMVETFNGLGQPEVMTPQIRSMLREIDAKCGKIETIERVNTTAFGSNVVRDYLVVRHSGCLILYKLTWAKRQSAWQFRSFNFSTLDGNEWSY